MQKEDTLTPKILGYAGLIPFFSGAALAVFGPENVAITSAEITALYGGLILSFLGGINWGLYVLAEPEDRSADWLVLGVVPSLIALFSLTFGGALGQVIMLVGFLVIFVDHAAIGKRVHYPDWFMPLRRNLSLGAVISLGALLV